MPVLGSTSGATSASSTSGLKSAPRMAYRPPPDPRDRRSRLTRLNLHLGGKGARFDRDHEEEVALTPKVRHVRDERGRPKLTA